jgi:hypothetical protein
MKVFIPVIWSNVMFHSPLALQSPVVLVVSFVLVLGLVFEECFGFSFSFNNNFPLLLVIVMSCFSFGYFCCYKPLCALFAYKLTEKNPSS